MITAADVLMEGTVYTDDPQELTSSAVLRRDIPWDIYKSARFISDRELQLIKRYDKKDASYQVKLLAEVGYLAIPAVSRVSCPRTLARNNLLIQWPWDPVQGASHMSVLGLVLQAGPAYVEAFETVLKNVAKDETVQYVLALLEDMLAGALAGVPSALRAIM